MAKNNQWRYHAAKRRREQKLHDFAKMYGPTSESWAFTPTGRVTMAPARQSSPLWAGLTKYNDKGEPVPMGLASHAWGALNDHPSPLATADFSSIEARILAQMAMSRDRVRFTLDTANMDEATRAAFRQAFNMSPPGWKRGDVFVVQPTVATIVCRPSQFARFLIYRNELGGRNLFKELNAVLFTPEPSEQTIDVSGNPAQ